MENQPRFLEPLKPSYQIREGQPVKLSCRFDAHPRGEIQWLKDGKPIDFEALGISRDFKVSRSSILSKEKYHSHISIHVQVVKEVDYTALLIKEAFPEDTGSYTVIIRNTIGEVRSQTQLAVEEFFCRTPYKN